MDEGSSFKKETARFEINSNQSMWKLYFWQAENGRFSKIDKPPKVEKLDLVHIDVWGTSHVSSIRGSLHYATFIDDSTGKVWVYFLKKK